MPTPVITGTSATGTVSDESAELELKKGGRGGRGGGIWIVVLSSGSSREGVASVLLVAAVAGVCIMAL
jgi:uncharacterized membrane protein YebE (DUF533 family)